MSYDAADFLTNRRAYGGVRRAWNEAMRSWDIVLVLDGHYLDETEAEEMREHHETLYRRGAEGSGFVPEDPGATYRYGPVS